MKFRFLFLGVLVAFMFQPMVQAEEISQLDQLPTIDKDATRLILVRHVETYHNATPGMDKNDPNYFAITPKGTAQSKAIGKALEGQPINVAYSSVTERTIATLKLSGIAPANGLKAQANEAFNRPIDGSIGKGKTSTFAWRIKQWNNGIDPKPEGGESLSDATKRCFNFVRKLKHSQGKAVVIVTHGDIIASVVGSAAGIPVWDRWEKFNGETGSISVVDVYTSGPAVLRAFSLVPRLLPCSCCKAEK